MKNEVVHEIGKKLWYERNERLYDENGNLCVALSTIYGERGLNDTKISPLYAPIILAVLKKDGKTFKKILKASGEENVNREYIMIHLVAPRKSFFIYSDTGFETIEYLDSFTIYKS
jgi:hypothetical protein